MLAKDVVSHRVDIIKQKLGLSSLIETITGKSINREGTSKCPFCDKSGKWFTIRDTTGWCYSASCPSNISKKKLDVISLYQWHYDTSFLSTLNKLEEMIGLNTTSELQDRYEKRHKFLSQVISIYQSLLWSNPGKAGLEYLRQRGFSDATIQNSFIGYVPYRNCLQSFNLSIPSLLEEGLYNPTYKSEYYSQNRVIFPLRDSWGRFVHLQSRFIGPIPKDDKGEDIFPRYKATLSCNLIPISHCLFLKERLSSYKQSNSLSLEQTKLDEGKTLFITEGIPDALSLVQLGLPAVGMIGINNLIDHHSSLSDFNQIYILGDNDRFSKHHPHFPNQYKSWIKLYPHAVSLQKTLGSSVIRCWMPPRSYKGSPVKDINDLLRLGINTKELLSLISSHYWDVVTFSILSKAKSLSNHQELLSLISSTGRGKSLLLKHIPPLSPIDYALSIFSL